MKSIYMNYVLAHVPKSILRFFGSAVLFSLGYGMMLIPHYSVDSYAIAIHPMEMYWSGCRAGRPMFMAAAKICEALKFDLVRQQWACTLLLILGCIISHLLVYTAVRRYVCKQASRGKAAVLFCSLAMAFCNPFLIEWFQYVEIAPIYSVCICLAVLGAVLLLRNKRGDWLLALLCLLVAVTGYQVVIAVFLILSVMLLLVKYDYSPTGKAFWEMVRCVAITGAAGVTSLLWARWLPTKMGIAPRLSDSSILDNLRYVRSIQPQVWKDTLGLLPKGIVALFLLLCVVLIFIPFVIQKDWKRVFWIGFVLAGCAATVFLPHAVSSEHWLTARASVQFFSFVAGAAVLAILNAGKVQAYIIGLASSALLAVILLYNNQITFDQLQSNQYDKEECNAIAQAIEQYENETGIVVTGIALCTDTQPHYYYSGIRRHWAELNMRAMIVDWGVHDAVFFYTGKPLENRGAIKPPVFEGRNWDHFDPFEQLYFEGDTVYFCAY